MQFLCCIFLLQLERILSFDCDFKTVLTDLKKKIKTFNALRRIPFGTVLIATFGVV